MNSLTARLLILSSEYQMALNLPAQRSIDGELDHVLQELRTIDERLTRQERQINDLQDQVELERQRYHDFFESLPDAHFITNARGRVLEANRAFARLLNRPVEAMAGQSVQSLFISADQPAARHNISQLRHSHMPLDWVAQLEPCKGSSRTWMRIRVSAIADREDNLVGMRWTLCDISEQKQLEIENQRLKDNSALEQERSARKQLESLLAARDQFFAVLSHELRTPLTPVLMSLEDLALRQELSAETREDLERNHRLLEIQIRLLDDLLDTTRAMRGKLNIEKRPVDICQIVRSSIDICHEAFAAKSIKMCYESHNDHDYVLGDGARLHQVFWNLLRNAVKFTAPHGTVSVRITRQAHDSIHIQITDTGIGITREALPRIFEPFEQTNSAITQHFGGLGLGLTIVKNVVEAHNGNVTAESAGQGKGATFTVILPCFHGKHITRKQAHTQQIHARTPRRILLVDDHTETLHVLTRLLRSLGHQVETANCIASALEAIQQHNRFDVLLCDIELPDGQGTELLKKIQNNRPNLTIALSGYGSYEDQARSKEAGFMHHLVKPIHLAQIESLLQNSD